MTWVSFDKYEKTLYNMQKRNSMEKEKLKDNEIMIDGEKAVITPNDPTIPKDLLLPDLTQYKLDDFIPVLVLLRSTLKAVSTAPTLIPRNFMEQVVLYSSGGTYRIYFYIVGVGWKYATLT